MFSQFDRLRLIIKPLRERTHEVALAQQAPLDAVPAGVDPASMRALEQLGDRLLAARDEGTAIIWLLDGAALRANVAQHLIDLMERKWITHLALDGEAAVFDFEIACVGATCENRAHYLTSGEYGLWKETSEMNDIVRLGAANDQGLGQSLALAMAQGFFPYKEHSLLAAGLRLGVPVTVHVGIGVDTLSEHPNFDPASYATASYRDFLMLATALDRLERGVVVRIAEPSAAVDVFPAALSMARNVAAQERRTIAQFTSAVLACNPHGAPSRDMVAALPIQGELRDLIPLARWAAIRAESLRPALP